MEVKYYIIIGIISALVIVLRNRNEKEAKNIEEKKQLEKNQEKCYKIFKILLTLIILSLKVL